MIEAAAPAGTITQAFSWLPPASEVGAALRSRRRPTPRHTPGSWRRRSKTLPSGNRQAAPCPAPSRSPIIERRSGCCMPVCKRPRTRGVPQDQAGLAAALITSSFQLGSALGLAVFSGIATSRTSHLPAPHPRRHPPPDSKHCPGNASTTQEMHTKHPRRLQRRHPDSDSRYRRVGARLSGAQQAVGRRGVSHAPCRRWLACEASSGDRLHPRLTHRACWLDRLGELHDRPSADGAGFIVGAAPGRCRARSDAVTGKSFRRGAGLSS